MSPTNNPGHIIAQDIEPNDATETFGMGEPYTQSEIEDLLYGDDRPAAQRLARLRELRDASATRESGDWGDQDPASAMDEIDRAIDELSAMIANADDIDDNYAELVPAMGDGADRLDALSPDDTDALDAIRGEESQPDDEPTPLDETEWQDGDRFDPARGVH